MCRCVYIEALLFMNKCHWSKLGARVQVVGLRVLSLGFGLQLQAPFWKNPVVELSGNHDAIKLTRTYVSIELCGHWSAIGTSYNHS